MSKKTLFVTRYYPIPAHAGALQYSSQLIRIFARLSARVSVLCQSRPGEHDTDLKPGGEFPENVTFFAGPSRHPSLWDEVFTPLPHSAIGHGTKENLGRLQERLRDDPSWVVVDHIGSAWATDALRAYKQANPATQIIYCTHNMEKEVRTSLLKTSYGRPKVFLGSLIDICRIDRIERKMAAVSDVVTCISSSDWLRYREIYGVKTGVVIRPIYQGAVKTARTIDASVPRRVCLVGSFEWSVKKKNMMDFVRETYVPFTARDIQLFVVGRMGNTLRETLRAQWPAVTFTGDVPEVESYMASCRIGVIPETLGGGFKLKSLEYVFNRLPIFALENTVVDVPLVDGEGIETAPDMPGLCRAITEKIEDLDHLNTMQQTAFDACAGFTSEENQEKAFRDEMLKVCRVEGIKAG